jgi:hypothetical protein
MYLRTICIASIRTLVHHECDELCFAYLLFDCVIQYISNYTAEIVLQDVPVKTVAGAK